MNFEELSAIWNSQDKELEKSLQINKALVKDIGIAKVKSRLRDIKWRAFIGIPVVICWLLILERFIVENLLDPKFSLPASVLFILSFYNLVFEIYRLILYYTIDSKLSVAETQKKIVRLKQLEQFDTDSLLIIIPMYSGPFLIVMAKKVAHLSLYTFDMTWLLLYTAGSIVLAAIIVFVLRKFPNKNLTESLAFLDELKE